MVDLNKSKGYSITVFTLAILDMAWAVLAIIKLHFTSSWWYLAIGIIIEAFFIFDYVARLVQADGKWKFIRHSMFDFIALLSIHPSLTFFRLPRVISITHLPEKIKSTKFWSHIQKYIDIASKFLYTNGLVHAVYINFFAIIIGSVLVYLLEKGITFPTFGDAVWWAFVTVTTVGYGDYVPKTVLGRTVAIVLMMVGIGLISMLTGTIATYFSSMKKQKTAEEMDLDELKSITTSMEGDQVHQLLLVARKIKNKDQIDSGNQNKEGSPGNDENKNNDSLPPETKI